MTSEEREAVVRLLNAANSLDMYRTHLQDCDQYYTDCCTCGLVRVRNEAREAHTLCRNLVNSSIPSTETKTT
jgi:hypothetical protein